MSISLHIGCKHCENTLLYNHQTQVTEEGFTQTNFPIFTQFKNNEMYALFAEGKYKCPFCENTLYITEHLKHALLELALAPCITNILDESIQFLSNDHCIRIPYESNPYSLYEFLIDQNQSYLITVAPSDESFRALMIAMTEYDLSKWHIQVNPLNFDIYKCLVQHI